MGSLPFPYERPHGEFSWHSFYVWYRVTEMDCYRQLCLCARPGRASCLRPTSFVLEQSQRTRGRDRATFWERDTLTDILLYMTLPRTGNSSGSLLIIREWVVQSTTYASRVKVKATGYDVSNSKSMLSFASKGRARRGHPELFGLALSGACSRQVSHGLSAQEYLR